MEGNSLIKAAKILALVSLFALTSACGGGGGGSSTPAATPAETACSWDVSNWDACNWQ